MRINKYEKKKLCNRQNPNGNRNWNGNWNGNERIMEK